MAREPAMGRLFSVIMQTCASVWVPLLVAAVVADVAGLVLAVHAWRVLIPGEHPVPLLLLIGHARPGLLTEDPGESGPAPQKSRRELTMPSRPTLWTAVRWPSAP